MEESVHPGEPVSVEPDGLERLVGGEGALLDGGDAVAGQVQHLQRREAAELDGGDVPQPVAARPQPPERREAEPAEAVDAVVADGEGLEVAEGVDGGGDLAAEPVAAEVEDGEAARVGEEPIGQLLEPVVSEWMNQNQELRIVLINSPFRKSLSNGLHY